MGSTGGGFRGIDGVLGVAGAVKDFNGDSGRARDEGCTVERDDVDELVVKLEGGLVTGSSRDIGTPGTTLSCGRAPMSTAECDCESGDGATSRV
jgi:hypothetical protein